MIIMDNIKNFKNAKNLNLTDLRQDFISIIITFSNLNTYIPDLKKRFVVELK
jgi:hypothetical protein